MTLYLNILGLPVRSSELGRKETEDRKSQSGFEDEECGQAGEGEARQEVV